MPVLNFSYILLGAVGMGFAFVHLKIKSRLIKNIITDSEIGENNA